MSKTNVKLDFMQAMREHQRAIEEALNKYAAFTPTTEPDAASVAAQAERLYAAVDLYLEAQAQQEMAQQQCDVSVGTTDRDRDRYVAARVKKLQAATFAEIAAAQVAAANEWDVKRRAWLVYQAALAQLQTVERELRSLLPKYVWVKYPARNLWIGVNSGTWGGYSETVHIKQDGDKLPRLEHTTYYD